MRTVRCRAPRTSITILDDYGRPIWPDEGNSTVKSDDPIADALLGDSVYERIRVERWSLFKQPIPRKLAIQSTLLFALAAILPVAAFLPAEVRESYLQEVAAASPKVALLALLAVAVVGLTGIGLAGVGIQRFRLEPSLTEGQARELFNLESLCSTLGFLTGGFATAVTYAFLLIGFGGTSALTAFMKYGGGNPYAASGINLDIATVAVAALVGAVVLRVLSVYLFVEDVRRSMATA
jgi:hypothetical protein